jgi:Acyl-protein synthetase, LuxE
MSPDELLAAAPFSLGGDEKEHALGAALEALVAHHRAACPAYARVLDALWPAASAAEGDGDRLAAIPWLPVGLFKTHDLVSVAPDDVVKTLTSSGTSGQARSRILLDRASTARQTRALAAAMRPVLGAERRPMLIVDARETVADRLSFNARAAGIRGMSIFGRNQHFLLNSEQRVDYNALHTWLRENDGAPLFVFGFTFMVWRYLATLGVELPRGTVLVHGGGWKSLAAEAVSRAEFAATLRSSCGIERVCDYYGMVEQIGSVFPEGECGLLHAPNHADVIVRDPQTWLPAPDGAEGVVEVLSALPTSYPGHAILTEDRGTVVLRDGCECGWRGAGIRVAGRLPQAELRGCSDVAATTMQGYAEAA